MILSKKGKIIWNGTAKKKNSSQRQLTIKAQEQTCENEKNLFPKKPVMSLGNLERN